MSARSKQLGVRDDPAALAPLKKADDSRLDQLAGRREVRVLQEILERLSQQAGSHGNRMLEAHHVLLLHLLGFYSPVVRSLRTFELASQNQHIQKVVGLERICRSTHSDFLAAADPSVLMPLVKVLRENIPSAALTGDNQDLATLLESVVAYDGSYFEVPVTVAWAMHMHCSAADTTAKRAAGKPKKTDRAIRYHMAQIRLNLHWATRRGVPMGMSIDGAKGSESDAFIKSLEPNVIYAIDRGIFSFPCLEALHQHNSHYVARLNAKVVLTPHRERPLTAEDASHGVISDRIGHFPGSHGHPAPPWLVREVILVNPAHPDRPIRLITDLLELPAYIIGLLYQERWQIELFFRWLKVHNHFSHLVTHSQKGMGFVYYSMVIALLLHTILRGRPPSKYDVVVYQMSLLDGTLDPGMVAGLARLEREKELARQRYARKKAMKKLA